MRVKMLIPDTLFFCILNEKGLTCFPKINRRSVGRRRYWKTVTPEEREAYSKMRSRVQKETVKNNPHLREIRRQSFKKVTQKYWDSISEEKKQEHINKMSRGMKKKWDNANPENFAPLKALLENNIKKNIFEIEEVERINDYAGVITESQLLQLNQQ